jgi:cobalt/nickel transport system permease protein
LHLNDGILPAPIVIVTDVAALGLFVYSMRDIEQARIPRLALLSSAFFVASLVINVPLLGASVHPTLGGVIGALAGKNVFAVISPAVVMQAVMFGHGGITAAGANVISMALPPFLLTPLFRRSINSTDRRRSALSASALGAGCAFLSAALSAGIAAIGDSSLLLFSAVWWTAYLPVIVIESIITAPVLLAVRKARPELFR